MDTTTRPNPYAKWHVDVPEVDDHPRVRVRRFTVGEHDLGNLREAMRGRQTYPGTYTRLDVDGVLWMTDTDAEIRDHFPILWALDGRDPVSVLIHGLGLGMVLGAALNAPTVQHVDVVELDEDVIDVIGPHYTKRAAERGIQLTIHHDDALTKTWPRGVWWDVAWHDIWPNLCTDDLDEHAKLNRRFARRVGWQGCWGHDLLLRQRRAERARGWW